MGTSAKVETLAVDGGTAVHTTGWPAWPDNTEANWSERVEPLMRRVYLSRHEGLPNTLGREFEAKWCEYAGVKHAVLTSHGTDALQAAVAGALDADGIGFAGEILCPEYTFIASASAPLALQCRICFVDADPDSFNLDPAAVEAAIGPDTTALMAVHLGGHPADLDALGAIAKKHGLALIEDCAQAHGAIHRGRQVGSIGSIGGFSYQSSKNLTSGEGGLVTTQDESILNRAYAYLNIGRYRTFERWEHPRIGWNYRADEYEAALLLARFETFDAEAEKREANGRYLSELLADVGGLIPPKRQPWCDRHAYHLYILRYQPEAFGGRPRAEFLKALNAEGIPSGVGYAKLLSEQDGIKAVAANHPDRVRVTDAPHTRGILADSLWLSQSMLLAEREDMEQIAAAVDKIRRAWS